MENAKSIFEVSINEHLEVIHALHEQCEVLERIAAQMSHALMDGGTIVWCGNGGSAGDAQHLAAELVGRFMQERRGLPSIALSTNTSVLTAIANDYGYQHVFRRQVEALCTSRDVIVGISTSGTSRNVCAALETGRQIGAFTVALTGLRDGPLAAIAHETVRVASTETPRIQEGHILCGHMLCDYVERRVCSKEAIATGTASR